MTLHDAYDLLDEEDVILVSDKRTRLQKQIVKAQYDNDISYEGYVNELAKLDGKKCPYPNYNWMDA